MEDTLSAQIVHGVNKIAVLRANGIGDFVFTLPALEALRAAYPVAEIVLLGKAWHAEFLARRPSPVDRVEVIPPARGVGEPEDAPEDAEALRVFFKLMAKERFDLALQLHGGGRFSNPFVRRLGARLTAGLRSPDAAPLDRWIPYVYWQHEIMRFLEVVQLVGAVPVTIAPRFAITDADVAESLRIVPPSDRPLVALNPGAGDPERRWPPEAFAAVGDALAVAGARIVITGAAWDRPLAMAIQAAMRHGAEDTTGQLTLGGLAGLFSRCAVMISNDSGPLHLATAVGAATVGIYWCFNMVNAGPVQTARHRPVIAWQTTCPVCGIDRAAARCRHHPSFTASIAPEHVIAAARELLDQRQLPETPGCAPGTAAMLAVGMPEPGSSAHA